MNRRILQSFFVIVLSTTGISHAAHEFTIVAQRGDVIDGFTIGGFSEEATFAINNQKDVAFVASVRSEGDIQSSLAVMTSQRFVAGAISNGNLGIESEDFALSINNHGQVAYSARLDGEIVLFLDDELVFSTGLIQGHSAIVTSGSLGRNALSVDDSGTTYFSANFEMQDQAMVANGEVVIGPGSIRDGVKIDYVSAFEVNSQGHISFIANTVDGLSLFVGESRVLGVGDTISGVPVNGFRLANMNGAGNVATLFWNTGARSNRFVAINDEVVLKSGDLVAGKEILHVSDAKITDNDVIVFRGQFLDENGDKTLGLFHGDELILQRGDELNGKIVDFIWSSFEVNELGDVAARVEFFDSSQAIIVVTVPEPGGICLALAALVCGIVLRGPIRSQPKRLP